MNAQIRSLFLRLRDDRRGLTTVEYAIVLCLIATVVVTTWQKFGADVKAKLIASTSTITKQMDTGLSNAKTDK